MGIIIDPATGEILALANVPLFDPNHSGRSTALQRRNRVIADAYEPGSTFKVIAAAAVLEDGLAQVNEQVDCEDGLLTLSNGDLIRDITPHGNLTFAEVSNNPAICDKVCSSFAPCTILPIHPRLVLLREVELNCPQKAAGYCSVLVAV